MRTAVTSRFVLLLAGAACLAGAVACRKGDDGDEGRRATVQAERVAQETTITSGELAIDAAADESLRARAESLVAFRREQLDAKGALQKDIDKLDEQLATLRQAIEARGPASSREEQIRARNLLARRELLKRDIDAIDRSTAEEWPSLRARVEHDLFPSPALEPRSDRPWAEPPPPRPNAK